MNNLYLNNLKIYRPVGFCRSCRTVPFNLKLEGLVGFARIPNRKKKIIKNNKKIIVKRCSVEDHTPRASASHAGILTSEPPSWRLRESFINTRSGTVAAS